MTNSADRLTILTGIEACRPGSEDIASPELAHVADAIAADAELERHYAAVQQSDAAVAEAFRNVPPPAGLQERLLAVLDNAEVDAADTVETSLPTVRQAVDQKPPSRRWLVAGGIAASLLIAAGIGISVWNQPSPASEHQIANVATDLHLAPSPKTLQAISSSPASHPTFPGLRSGLTPLGWAKVSGLGDKRAIAYAYSIPRVGTATLYVFRPRVIDPLLPKVPGAPVQSSGVTVGVWATGGLVYALVVDGGEHQYWGFVPKPDLA